MSTLTGRIFAGHLRSIIGSMTVEEIVTERQKLASEVLDGSKAEMVKIGLTVDSLQIQSIDDLNSGYIDAMAAPHTAAIQRQAQIAQAQANQAAAQARAGVAAQAGRVRAADRRGPGPVQGRDRQGAGRGVAGRTAQPGADPDRGHQRPGGTGPAPGRAAPAPAGGRGGQAGRGGGGEGAHPGQGGRRADADPGRGGGLERPGGAGPDAHRPAPADRQGSGERPGRRQRQRAQRGGRAQRDRGRPGRPGADHPGLDQEEPRHRAGGHRAASAEVVRVPDSQQDGQARG